MKKKKHPKKPCLYGLLAVLVALGACSGVLAGQMPKGGDLALGPVLGSANTYGDYRTTFGISFEFWADSEWSYQAGFVSTTEDYDLSAYSASAWHYTFGRGAGLFGSAGIAAANARGVQADVGAGLEFFPGRSSIQLKADYLYALDSGQVDDRSSIAYSGAWRVRW